MSEKLLRFLLTELEIVRVKCLAPGCLRVMEVSIDKLSATLAENKCPFCQKGFDNVAPYGLLRTHIHNLAEAIKAIKASKEQIEMSFELPDKTTEK